MATNILILHDCAYLFHSSYNNFYISAKVYEANKAVQKFLKDNSLKPIPYTLTEEGCILIKFDSLNIFINDSMILEISGEYKNKDIVNGRTFKDLRPFHSENTRNFLQFNEYRNGNDQYFWGSKFRSLEIEKFSDSLMYYRLHFKGNIICIVSSCGRLFLARSCNYKEISKDYILSRLDANSNEARKIFSSFLDYITL